MRSWVFKALCSVVLEGTYSNLYLKNHLKEVPKERSGIVHKDLLWNDSKL